MNPTCVYTQFASDGKKTIPRFDRQKHGDSFGYTVSSLYYLLISNQDNSLMTITTKFCSIRNAFSFDLSVRLSPSNPCMN